MDSSCAPEQGKDVFEAEYDRSQTRFADLVSELGWQLERGPVVEREKTASNRPLQPTVGISPGSASRALVLSTGLHGVEGELGSAVVFDFLQGVLNGTRTQNSDLKVILLHCLNPFGYCYSRRFDEFNRDLNRNFLLPGEGYAGCKELYHRLDGLINPVYQIPSFLFYLKAALTCIRFGFSDVSEAIAGGQYEYPQGLFFGGHEPSALSGWLASEMPEWLGQARNVVHLDFHTGLGKFGGSQMLIESPASDSWQKQLEDLLPDVRTLCVHGSKEIYQATGSFGRWCSHVFARPASPSGESERKYFFAVAEFGTYGPLRVLNALRRENVVHHQRANGKSVRTSDIDAVKRQLRDVFCPTSPTWRKAVLGQASRMIDGCLQLQREAE